MAPVMMIHGVARLRASWRRFPPPVPWALMVQLPGEPVNDPTGKDEAVRFKALAVEGPEVQWVSRQHLPSTYLCPLTAALQTGRRDACRVGHLSTVSRRPGRASGTRVKETFCHAQAKALLTPAYFARFAHSIRMQFRVTALLIGPL
jgi:hypothetical protein